MLCLLVGGAVVLVHQRPRTAVLPVQSAGTAATGLQGADLRAEAATTLLDRLQVALATGTRQQVVALAAPGDRGARRELATLRHNVRVLGITDLSLRYVDEQTMPSTTQPGEDDRTWVGDVQLFWGYRGSGSQRGRIEVPIVLRQDGQGARFVTARRRHSGATPLWLLDRVRTTTTARSMVVTTGSGPAPRFSGLADQAVLDVRKVLTRWRGRLVVEVPPDQQTLTRVLGAKAGTYDEIAAVTTTVDGSFTSTAPVHIFVNPRVFDPLGARGSQVVMSHEATHVATGGATSRLPLWLLEGFADYVALAHADLPVSQAASQILGQVSRHGVPEHLPGKREFASDNTQLGASYESAWLACRLLAERYGERRLIAFYRASDRRSATRAAFRSVLGTDQRDFTRLWQADLRALAR